LEFKITFTCGAGAVVEEVTSFLKKLKVVCNSSSNSLLFYYCLKFLIFFAMGACNSGGST
jgi:hypothetical protein